MRRLSPARPRPRSTARAAAPRRARRSPSVRLTLLSQTPWNCPTAAEPARLSPPSPFAVPRWARARAAVPRREPRGGAARRPRDRRDALLADPDPQRLPGLVGRGPIPRDRRRGAGPHRNDRAGLVPRLRDRLHARPRDRHGPVRRVSSRWTCAAGPPRSPSSHAGDLPRPQPEVPLDLSWTFVLHHPITFAPDGVFTDPSLEVALERGAGSTARSDRCSRSRPTPS